MSLKTWITIGILIGSTLGAYIPGLWGDQSLFSIPSIIFSTLGGLAGVWLGWQGYQRYS